MLLSAKGFDLTKPIQSPTYSIIPGMQDNVAQWAGFFITSAFRNESEI